MKDVGLRFVFRVQNTKAVFRVARARTHTDDPLAQFVYVPAPLYQTGTACLRLVSLTSWRRTQIRPWSGAP